MDPAASQHANLPSSRPGSGMMQPAAPPQSFTNGVTVVSPSSSSSASSSRYPQHGHPPMSSFKPPPPAPVPPSPEDIARDVRIVFHNMGLDNGGGGDGS